MNDFTNIMNIKTLQMQIESVEKQLTKEWSAKTMERLKDKLASLKYQEREILSRMESE